MGGIIIVEQEAEQIAERYGPAVVTKIQEAAAELGPVIYDAAAKAETGGKAVYHGIALAVGAAAAAASAIWAAVKSKPKTKAGSTTACPATAPAGGGGGGGGKKSKRRFDSDASSREAAIREAKEKAGDKGQPDWEDIKHPKTGETIGRKSPDGKQEWRVDEPHTDLDPGERASREPHVNWKDWSLGKRAALTATSFSNEQNDEARLALSGSA